MKIILFLSTIILGSFAHWDILLSDYSGSWEYSVDTPQGAYQGTLVLSKVEDGYEGHLLSQEKKYELKDLTVVDNNLSCKLNFEGYEVVLKGGFENQRLNAKAFVEGYELPFVAVKKE